MNLYILACDFLNCHGILKMSCKFGRVKDGILYLHFV